MAATLRLSRKWPTIKRQLVLLLGVCLLATTGCESRSEVSSTTAAPAGKAHHDDDTLLPLMRRITLEIPLAVKAQRPASSASA
jgi:hypothetical protein